MYTFKSNTKLKKCKENNKKSYYRKKYAPKKSALFTTRTFKKFIYCNKLKNNLILFYRIRIY